MATETRPSAVLWDFDGTMLDTEKVWIASEIQVMADYGAQWTYERGLALCGSAAAVSSRLLHDEITAQLGRPPKESPESLWARVYLRVKRYLEDEGLPWLPGARELVESLSELDVPMAVVSASPPDLIGAGLDQMPAHWFRTVVSGPEMPRGKPAPDSYLMAADRLGVPSPDCIVIEDSVPGTTAGRAAGAVVIAVPCMHPLPTAEGQVNLDSLAGLGPEDLTRIWYEVRGR